jgi:outer membrane protein OmpA-like peptidoglycan-associated protein
MGAGMGFTDAVGSPQFRFFASVGYLPLERKKQSPPPPPPPSMGRLMVEKSGSGMGEVLSVPAGIACGTQCSGDFKLGGRVVLHARPGTDSHFIGWSGPCSGTQDCVVTIQGEERVGVEFAHNQEKRSPMVVEKVGDGEGEVISDPSGISCGKVCDASFRTGQEVRFVAVPDKDSRFAGWEGPCSGVEPCTVVVRGEPHLKARFIKAQIVVTPQKLDLQGNVIHFETAKSIIDVDSYYLLDEVVVILKQYQQMRLRIEGHTDAVPYSAPGGNLQLSKDRATSVVQYLVDHGIVGSRLTSEGFGDTCPVATNQTAEGRQANRRTEFLVVDPKTGEYQRTPCVTYTPAPQPFRPHKGQPGGAAPRKPGAAPAKQQPLQKAPAK